MSRFKQVIGYAKRSHADERRAAEMEVVVQVVNRMIDLGCPDAVRNT